MKARIEFPLLTENQIRRPTALSRAEAEILRLASRAVGYDPHDDGPWWVLVFWPLASRTIRRLWRKGLLRASREGSGIVLIRTTRRGAMAAEEEADDVSA